MKFNSRIAEHVTRSSVAFIFVMLLVLRKDDGSLLSHLVTAEWMKTVATLFILLFAGWLAFGKLYTTRR